MLVVALWGAAPALADGDPVEARAGEVVPEPAPPESGLRFLGLLDAKLTVSDIATTSPLVNGQIVGTLGGTNATTLQTMPGLYTEQRATGIFAYTPKVMGGRATLTAGFEVDFAWGDSSYSIGGNTGGGFGGDQVNLQTRRLHGRFSLWKGTSAVVGLQFVGDGAADPERSRLDELVRGGGKLFFFGSEAAGVSVYGRALDGDAIWKVGGYTLSEVAFAEPDDITLWMADARWNPRYATHIGAHAWYLRDRAGGTSGAFGSGPTSALSDLQGGPSLDLASGDATTQPETSAALGWAAVDVGYNAGLDRGRFGATGLAVLNFGRLYVTDETDTDVLGVLANAEARYRWAPGQGSVVRAEGLLVTGDPDGDAPGDTYSGVVTGNSYGVAAATNVTHGCLLLFPDPISINRQVALNYDVSGGGAGLVGVSAQAGYDVVPNRLTVAVGGGHARPMVGEGEPGTEVNLRVVGRPLPLTTWGLYGGYVLGRHTDAELHPWAVYTALNWVVL